MILGLITPLVPFILPQGYMRWLDYPGFEAWKFAILFIFIATMVYLLKRLRVGDTFRERREAIRRDLMRAQEEKNAATAKLEEIEARLARVDSETAAIREQGMKEASEERERMRRSTEEEIKKLRDQARREIEGAGKTARYELRAFAAEQSVRLAEDMIRADIRPEDDARLFNHQVEELGSLSKH